MNRAGVLVSINSDDAELGRRLNTEAAKAVKYGGLSELEALALVTINPARQLRIDRRTGSLEPGKDADFVTWSGHPSSNYSRAELTWTDGRRSFDLDSDRSLRAAAASERLRLVALALRAPPPPSGDTKQPKDDAGSARSVITAHDLGSASWRSLLDRARELRPALYRPAQLARVHGSCAMKNTTADRLKIPAWLAWLARLAPSEMEPALALDLALVAQAAQASDTVPPSPQQRPLLITGAARHTVSGPVLVGGRMLIKRGRITAVGGAGEALPQPQRAAAEIVDLGGPCLPGLHPGQLCHRADRVQCRAGHGEPCRSGPDQPQCTSRGGRQRRQ